MATYCHYYTIQRYSTYFRVCGKVQRLIKEVRLGPLLTKTRKMTPLTLYKHLNIKTYFAVVVKIVHSARVQVVRFVKTSEEVRRGY